MIVEHKVRLSFPQRLLNQPLIYGLIHQYDLLTNILEAQVSQEEGCMVVAVRGEKLQVTQGLDWLRHQGVLVETLTEVEEEER